MLVKILLIILLIVVIVSFYIFEKKTIKKFWEFVDFLKEENDEETFSLLGFSYLGRITRYPRYSRPFAVRNRLKFMINETSKKEYSDFLKLYNRTFFKELFFVVFIMLNLAILDFLFF